MISKNNFFSGSTTFLTFVVFLFVGMIFASDSFAENLYVKKSGTKLQASDSAKSEVVAKLNQGTSASVIKKSKRFYQVSTPEGKKGWVFKFKLTSKAPTNSGGGGDVLGALGGRQKIAARESSSGSSIRGLSPISEKHGKNKGISEEEIQAVKQMEAYVIHPGEMEKFLKEGRLGEYGQ